MKQVIAALLTVLFLVISAGAAGSNAYNQTNLVSDQAGVAANTDPQLLNPWGIAFFPGAPFWIADNNSGVSTLYNGNGVKQGLVVTIPPANGTGPGTPTGIVANNTMKFGGYVFIFDTEDGAIVGWKALTTGVLVATKPSAVYKGLALITNGAGSFLLATNFNSGAVDVYDTNFQLTALGGNFTDPNLPSGYAPFGIRVLGSNVYVTYAKQDAAKHDPIEGKGLGFVSIFDVNGNFVKRFASAGALNAPWGVVIAPSSGFGALSGTALIGNFGDGKINAFNATTGKPMSNIHDAAGKPVVNAGLWEMVFGAGGTGDPSTLYITAGPGDEAHGLFAALKVVPVTLLPSSVKLSSPLNVQSAAKTVTLANNTNASISISAVAVSDNHFAITSNTCGANLAAGQTCKIKVAFTPIDPGTITGTLSVTDSGAGSPQKAKLTGKAI